MALYLNDCRNNCTNIIDLSAPCKKNIIDLSCCPNAAATRNWAMVSFLIVPFRAWPSPTFEGRRECKWSPISRIDDHERNHIKKIKIKINKQASRAARRHHQAPTPSSSTGGGRAKPQKSKPYYSHGASMAAGSHLRPGSYLGDVSALSFLPSSPRPLLLAGTFLLSLFVSPLARICVWGSGLARIGF